MNKYFLMVLGIEQSLGHAKQFSSMEVVPILIDIIL